MIVCNHNVDGNITFKPNIFPDAIRPEKTLMETALLRSIGVYWTQSLSK